ncbi:MAG: hypothetical protein RR636_07315 [Clostridium sp.]|uniref:hypothetical protein n=1 Tax=Clostridium sp. TaxID=1506 RepID=UPI00302C0DD2
MESLDNIIEKLQTGVSALIETRINDQSMIFFIIKDDFKKLIPSITSENIHFKAGVIKINSVILGSVVIDVEDWFDDKYYLFDFNYHNKSSLNFITGLAMQKNVYLIIVNSENECNEVLFENNLKQFFRNYMGNCMKEKYKWNEREYNYSKKEVVRFMPSVKSIWDNMGDVVCMTKEMKKVKKKHALCRKFI